MANISSGYTYVFVRTEDNPNLHSASRYPSFMESLTAMSYMGDAYYERGYEGFYLNGRWSLENSIDNFFENVNNPSELDSHVDSYKNCRDEISKNKITEIILKYYDYDYGNEFFGIGEARVDIKNKTIAHHFEDSEAYSSNPQIVSLENIYQAANVFLDNQNLAEGLIHLSHVCVDNDIDPDELAGYLYFSENVNRLGFDADAFTEYFYYSPRAEITEEVLMDVLRSEVADFAADFAE